MDAFGVWRDLSKEILTVVSLKNETWIDPKTGLASLKLMCSLTTLPLLEHRLRFDTTVSFRNTYTISHYGSNSVDTPMVQLGLTVFAPLQVNHGSFARADISVQPVCNNRASHLCLFSRAHA